MTIEEQLKQQAVVDQCDHGHRFLALPDHPKKDGHKRCPYCLAIGFDSIRAELSELQQSPISAFSCL